MRASGGQWLVPVFLGVLGITLARRVGPRLWVWTSEAPQRRAVRLDRMIQRMEGEPLRGAAAMFYRIHAALHRRMERERRETAEP